MIQFVDRYFSSSDDRGFLEGLINFGTWEEVNFVYSDKGSIRGNHYHKSTKEAFIILSGNIVATFQKVQDGKLIGDNLIYKVDKRKVFIIEPMVNHVFFVEESAEWINLLSCKMSSNSPDFYRINY